MAMRPQDKTAFADAARSIGVWIFVRRTKREALQYVGRAGYSPKAINCKAKTADKDLGRYKLAGLVTSPKVHAAAFKQEKLPDVNEKWASFEREFLSPAGGRGEYEVESDRNSQHFGVVKRHGQYVHADYDLYDIILPEQAQRNLAAVESLLGQAHRRGPKFYEVQNFLNRRIGSDMVQHGGEAQYADHSEQSIDAFGPNGEEFTILNEYSVRAWYENQFGGRQALGRGNR